MINRIFTAASQTRTGGDLVSYDNQNIILYNNRFSVRLTTYESSDGSGDELASTNYAGASATALFNLSAGEGEDQYNFGMTGSLETLIIDALAVSGVGSVRITIDGAIQPEVRSNPFRADQITHDNLESEFQKSDLQMQWLLEALSGGTTISNGGTADLSLLNLQTVPAGQPNGNATLRLFNGATPLGTIKQVSLQATGTGDDINLDLIYDDVRIARISASDLGITEGGGGEEGGGLSPEDFELELTFSEGNASLNLNFRDDPDNTVSLLLVSSRGDVTLALDGNSQPILTLSEDSVDNRHVANNLFNTVATVNRLVANGVIPGNKIQINTIASQQLVNGLITSLKYGTGSLTATQVLRVIADSAIPLSKLSSGVRDSLAKADTVGDRPEDISDSVWEQLTDQSNDDINAEDHAKLNAIIESDGRITPRAWNDLDFDEVSNASGANANTFVDTTFLDSLSTPVDISGTPTAFTNSSPSSLHELARLFVYEKTLAREQCKYADVDSAAQAIKVFYQTGDGVPRRNFEVYTVCGKSTRELVSGSNITPSRFERIIFLDNRLYSDPDFFDVPGFVREFQYDPVTDSLVEVHGLEGTLVSSLQVEFELSRKYKLSGALIENGSIPVGKLGTDSVINSNVESLAGNKIVEGTVTSRELSPDVDRKLDQTTTNRRNIFGDNFGFYDPNGESGVDDGHYPARSAELLGGLGAKFGSGTVTIAGREGAIEFHEDGTSSNLNPDICVYVKGDGSTTVPGSISIQPWGDDSPKVYRRSSTGGAQYDFGDGEEPSRRFLFTSAPASPPDSPKLNPMSAVDVARGFEHINFHNSMDGTGGTINSFVVARREQAPAFPGVAGDRYLQLALDTSIEVNSWLRGATSWSRSSVIAAGRSVGIGKRPPTRFSDPDAPLAIPGLLNTNGTSTFYLLAGDGITVTTDFNIRLNSSTLRVFDRPSTTYSPFSFRVVDTTTGNTVVKAAIVFTIFGGTAMNTHMYLALEDTAGNIQPSDLFSGIRISKNVNDNDTLSPEEKYDFMFDGSFQRDSSANLGDGTTDTTSFFFGDINGNTKDFRLDDAEGYNIEFIGNNRRYRGVSLNASQPEINSSEFNFWIETDNDDNLVDFWNWDQVWKKLDNDDFDDLGRRITHTEDVLGIGERDHRYPLGTHFEPRSPLEGKVGGGDNKYWITRDGAIYAYGDQATTLGSFTAPGDYTSPRYHQLVEFEQNSKTYLATVVAEAIGRGNSRARLQIVEIANGTIAARQEASNFNYSAVTDTTSENFIINHKPILGLTKTGDTEFTIAYVKQETDGRANAVHFARYAYSSTNPDSFNFGVTRFTEEDSPFVVSAERTFEAMSQTLDGTKLYVLWWELGVGFIIRSYTTAIVSEFFTISDEAVAAAVDETTISSGRRGTGRGLKVTADVGVIQELVVATTSALTIYAQDSIFHRIDNIEERLEEDNVMLLGSGEVDLSTANVFLSEANTPSITLPTTGELKISIGSNDVVASIPIINFESLTPADYGDASNSTASHLLANLYRGTNVTPLSLGITADRKLLIGTFVADTTARELMFYHVGGVGGGPAVAGESSGGLTEQQATNLIAEFARAQSPSGTIPDARLPATATRTDTAIETLATEEMAELLRSFCYRNTSDADILAALVALKLVKSDATGITSGTVINNIVSLSQADYDAIATKDPNTLYLTPVT